MACGRMKVISVDNSVSGSVSEAAKKLRLPINYLYRRKRATIALKLAEVKKTI